MQAVLNVEIPEIAEARANWDLSPIEVVIHDGAERSHATFEITQGRAGTTITGNLLIVKPGYTDPEGFGKILDHGPFKMELGASLIVRGRVLNVEGKAGCA